MAKSAPYIPSSNGGEYSPRMDGRVDFERYGSAVSRGLNLICLPQGGVTFCPGTRFIKEVKTSTSATALMAFEPVADQAYEIETGDLYFRFYRNQGRIEALTTTTAITNGTFSGSISGWTDRSTGGTASISYSAGLSLNGHASGYAWAEQAVTIPSGLGTQVHVIQFQLTGNHGSTATVQIGSTSTGTDIVVARGMGMGWHTIGFTPNTATIYLQFINENADNLVVHSVRVLSDEPLELTSPYPASVVGALRWAQSGDVKYITHGSYPRHKLERRGDTSWSLVRVFDEDGPWLEINPDTDLTLTNLIKNGSFSGGLAGWTQAVSGNGYINFPSTGTGAILGSAKDGAATSALSQGIVTTASAKIHVLHFQVVGGGQATLKIGTTDGADDIVAGAAYNPGWYTVSFTPGVSTFYINYSAAYALSAIAPGLNAAFCYTINARLLQPSALTGSITVTAKGDFKPFASTDVGRSIRFEYPGREPGWGIITAFSTAQSVTVRLYRNLPSTEPLESWRLGAWSDTTGYPHVCTFYQQRLISARTTLQPQTIWGSQSGDFENMRPDSWVAGAQSVQDNDSLNFTLASGIASPIVWLIGSRRLTCGTSIGEWAIQSKGPVLTPSDFSADPQTSVRALDAPPVQIDSGGVFIHRAKRALYDLGYDYKIDALSASDITILADHIARESFAQIVYQGAPFSNIWGRLEDGTLTCTTFKRDQNVVGTTPRLMGASLGGAAVVESLSVIPGSADSGQVYSSINRDELWMVVRYTIGGATKRYIVVMEGVFDGPNRASYLNKSDWRDAVKAAQVDAFYVDCGITYSGTATDTITGLSHLEGETVKVVADGAVQADKIVSGGSITLDLEASVVHVGLGYGWIYRGMKLPYGSPTGAGVGATKNVDGLVFVLRDAASFDYAIDLAGDGDEEQDDLQFTAVPFRRPADPMSESYPIFSGEVQVDAPDGNGFNTDPRIVMQGTAPMPFTLLGINPRIAETEL